MGKLFALMGIIVISFCSTAFADDAIDPTVWPKDQWRSDLFDIGGRTKPHGLVAVRRELRIERRVMMQDEALREMPRRARLIRIGENDDSAVAVRSVAGEARHCVGMLVLTWTGTGANARCHGVDRQSREAGP